MNIKQILLVMAASITTQSFAAEYFVRTDGGTLDQCDGKTNAAYSASVSNKACAVKHIFELLDPRSGSVNIAGGDVVNILNNEDGSIAEYPMGRHDDYTSGDCGSSWAYNCTMPSIPAGPDPLNPTVIRGGNGVTCDAKPSLWGTGRAKQIFKLDNTENVEISCLTITDHSGCIGATGYPDSSLICNRSAPYDKPFADTGIFMRDSNNIKLTDVDVQGLSKGILAGRVSDVTLTRVNLFANFHAGWDGDIGYLGGDGSSNSGTISFIDSSISFNGCGLIYNPGQPDHQTPHACAKQNLGGYGDGLGTEETGGDWIFDNVAVMHNNSDGIDLLYHHLGGTVTIKNSHIEGNAGNQLKVSGNANIINNLIIGTCAWNSRQDAKLGGNGENCRALGTALSVSYTHEDTQVHVINNTVYSEGDCIMSGGNRTGVSRTNQKLTAVNNIFYAMTDYLQSFENSCMYYSETPYPITRIHNNLIHKVKGFGDPCNSFHSNVPTGELTSICTTSTGSYYDNDDYSVSSNPKLTDIDLGHQYTAYDPKTLKLEANKPVPLNSLATVVDQGYNGDDLSAYLPDVDIFGDPRDNKPDLGAIEFKVKPKAPVILEVIEVAQ